MIDALKWVCGFAAYRYAERAAVAALPEQWNTARVLAGAATYFLAPRLLPESIATGAQVAAAWNATNSALEIVAQWSQRRAIEAEPPARDRYWLVRDLAIGAETVLNGGAASVARSLP